MKYYIIASAAFLLAPVAAAQEAGIGLVDAVSACRSVTDASARLACFDKAAAALASAQEKKEVVVLDRTEVKKTRRSLFGFTLPRIGFLAGDGEKDEPEIETSFASVRSLGYGKWGFRTAEDAQWQTTEGLQGPIKVGQKVTISRGALGNYFIRVPGQKSVRAVRVN